MQLASMVHGSGRDDTRMAHELRHSYHHQPFTHAQARVHQPHSDAASTLVSNPYAAQQSVDYQPQRRAPQSPPSPPVEEANKPSLPSLPSISSLLTYAENEKPAQGSRKSRSKYAVCSLQLTPHVAAQAPQQSQVQQQQQNQSQPAAAAAQSSEPRPAGSQAFGAAIVSNPRMTLPPTPPMRPDSVIDGNQSPSTTSTQSSFVAQQPYYLGSSLNNMEPHSQRQHIPVAPLKRHSVPSQSSASPYNTSPYAHSAYASSPGAASTGSYYSPEAHMLNASAMYAQRPLPSNFPPPPVQLPGTPQANSSNPWQHHHYISAQSQAAFPQPQDRYICQTCNKAFSRPSSLRIHSHSHTGEKPFKCPHGGCGKAFSVRSNMKRHERGCHANTGNMLPPQ